MGQQIKSVVSHEQIVVLCTRTLRLYDPRLVEHGERVAHIACAVNEALPLAERVDSKNLLLLSLFHDVGAYKTEEIDRMMEFESNNVLRHSVYGYLFLKHFTPLGDTSQAVLHHHLSYQKSGALGASIRTYADLIHIADRMDVALRAGRSKQELFTLLRGAAFSPHATSALHRLLRTTALYEELVEDGGFFDGVLARIGALHISDGEAFTYLEMLVHSIDFKSAFTVTHSINTTEISVFLAKQLGLPPPQIRKIYLAALIHDVGKMAIPERIVEFPGRLSDEDMAIMRRHVSYTEEILQGVLPQEIINIAVRHHEKLNGSGYPHGLTGEQLTQSDRIVAVADIVSALGSRRSYKEDFGKEKTLSILREMTADGLLDGGVTSVILQDYDAMRTVVDAKTQPVAALYELIQSEYVRLLSHYADENQTLPMPL